MKKVVNVRLDENILIILERLSKELNTTKTDIIEKSIKFFSNKKNQKDNSILRFAGILDKKDANNILEDIKNSKNSKDFTLDNI
jgi:predicted transcriptional regulator